MQPRVGEVTHSAPSAHCRICGATTVLKRVGITDLVICSDCGMGRVPQIKAGADYWLLGEGVEGESSNDYWIRARGRMFRSALRRLEQEGGKGRLVDMGGGIGYFAQCALESGWDAYSVDVSDWAIAAAAQRLGASRSLSNEKAQALAGTFDVVSLWCVIAHVPDPAALLSQAVNLIRPGGRVLLTTPNFIFQSAFARVLARFGRAYDLVGEDHQLHFTPASIKLLLENAGCKSWSFRYFGVTEDCLFERRLAPFLVPVKRAWNWSTTGAAGFGLPALSAELQVVANKPVS